MEGVRLEGARDAASRYWRAARVASRLPSAARRSLPDALIIGTQRGGTTSLYRWLAAHPQVQPPIDKEIQFFSLEWDRGVDWYRSHFGLDTDPRLNFEASPYYLYHPLAPARVASVLPDVRLVALLRDPVDRAWSHHRHNVRLGIEHLDFESAISAEEERLAGEAERLLDDPHYRSPNHRNFSYVDRGRYDAQFARWREVAGDRLLVLSSEDLFAEPDRTFQRVLQFLQLEPWHPVSFGNASRAPANGGPHLSEQERVLLGQRFSPHDHLLARTVRRYRAA